jgi:hypothetical protein
MIASTLYDIVMGYNSPPGLTHPILKENYKWVDERLSAMQYSTHYDYDDCEECGFIPCPCPIAWVDYRYNHIAHGIEDPDPVDVIENKRKRAESDISDHEEQVKNAFKKMKINDNSESKYKFTPLSNPFCNLDCEEYNYRCSLIEKDGDETDSELNELFNNWDSVIHREQERDTPSTIMDDVSVKCSYFDSDVEEDVDNLSVISEDEDDLEERQRFEEMMDGYDSDEWYINFSYLK